MLKNMHGPPRSGNQANASNSWMVTDIGSGLNTKRAGGHGMNDAIDTG